MTGEESAGFGGSATEDPPFPMTTRTPSFRVPIDSLPPLPTPDYDSKRRETIGGIVVVALIMTLLVGLTHGVALTAVGSVGVGSLGYRIFAGLIYAVALIAAICHLGVLLKDPGIIHRSAETCYPIPEKMQAWIWENSSEAQIDAFPMQQCTAGDKEQSGNLNGDSSTADVEDAGVWSQSVTALACSSTNPKKQSGNISALQKPADLYIVGRDDRVYCTRCLVWRKPGINHYHCQTCQRCVAYYDHHCTFFGRCVAGTLCYSGQHKPVCRGNFVFFVGIVIMGGLGYVTSVAALLCSLSWKYGVKWVLPIGFVVLLWIHATILKRSPRGICMMCRRCIVDICEVLRKCVLNKR
jgi:hypothetical protein